MKKVWVLVGVVLLCVLCIGAWFFIADLGGFSQLLGNKTKNALSDQSARFLGTWTSQEFGTITFFSSKMYRMGSQEGVWVIDTETVSLYETGDDAPLVVYQYVFSENDSLLQLTNGITEEQIVLRRQP
jgi:hypothetical protein